MGAAQLGRVTVQMKSIMSVCAAELARRLEPKSRSMEGVTAKYIVDEVLDVFSGLETQDQLFNHLAKKYPYIEPVEHVFGYDQVHTTDAEGFTYSKKDVKCSGWYMPMGRVVERLLQEDPRALEMVMRTQAEWAAEAPPHGTSKRVYIDVTHGDLFKEHPELGDAQRGKAQHGLRLCFILRFFAACANPDTPLTLLLHCVGRRAAVAIYSPKGLILAAWRLQWQRQRPPPSPLVGLDGLPCLGGMCGPVGCPLNALIVDPCGRTVCTPMCSGAFWLRPCV